MIWWMLQFVIGMRLNLHWLIIFGLFSMYLRVESFQQAFLRWKGQLNTNTTTNNNNNYYYCVVIYLLSCQTLLLETNFPGDFKWEILHPIGNVYSNTLINALPISSSTHYPSYATTSTRQQAKVVTLCLWCYLFTCFAHRYQHRLWINIQSVATVVFTQLVVIFFVLQLDSAYPLITR